MRNFIQLKDNIGFVLIQTDGETSGIEIFSESPHEFLNKKYENENWIITPIIKYAVLAPDNFIAQIKYTYFPSEIGNNPVMDESIPDNAQWDGNSWIIPTIE